MELEDENKVLRSTVAAAHACATAKEAAELESLVAEYGNATDCARSIMITPAVWARSQPKNNRRTSWTNRKLARWYCS
jgi:hypothetical protein